MEKSGGVSKIGGLLVQWRKRGNGLSGNKSNIGQKTGNQAREK